MNSDSPLGKRKEPETGVTKPVKKITPKIAFRPKMGANVLPTFPPPPSMPAEEASSPATVTKEEPLSTVEIEEENTPASPQEAPEIPDAEGDQKTDNPSDPEDEEDHVEEEDATEEEEKEKKAKKAKSTRRRRATQDVPEEEEEEEDTSMMTLGEIAVLCSRHVGKRKKPNAAPEDAEEEPEPEPQAAPERPQVEFVDGKLVVNEDSLVATVPSVPRRVAREGDTEIRLNQNSFRRKKISQKQWSKEQTQEFYTALRVFGPNLTNMTLLLRSRNRDQLRNKLRLEEKNNPHLVDFAVKHRIPISEEEVAALLRGEDVVISSPQSSVASSPASSAASSRSSSPAPRRPRLHSLRSIASTKKEKLSQDRPEIVESSRSPQLLNEEFLEADEE